MGDMDAYKEIFLEESAEYLQSVTEGLLALERAPHDRAPVETVFRGAHSLKGMSATMGYERTADLTHRMEGLMDRVRSESLPVTPELIDLMLTAVDQVRTLIEEESSGGSGLDVTGLAAALEAATLGSGPGEQPESAGPAGPEPKRAPDGGATRFEVRVTLEESCVLKAVRAYMVIKRLSHMGSVIDTVPSARDLEDERFERDFAVIVESVSTPREIETAVLGVSEVERTEIEASEAAPACVPDTSAGDGTCAPGAPEPDPAAGQPSRRRRATIPKLSETQTVRISIGHLDTMVDLVGEIVTVRARLDALAARIDSRELDEALEDLHRVSGELQHEVMLTRMVPVGNIFNRFPRMVRDLARDLGREVEFELGGVDIELDRTVLDEIGDPIVHLLRNSIDHGIEPAAARESQGKPGCGLIRLEALRERDTVRITVSDDGKGMDVERIWAKAVSLGLVAEEDRPAHSDEDILLLTCAPGFSTTEEATKVSGRGVGMDVVKGKIEHLGGTLTMRSRLGEGTSITLTLPLTLAIIQALLVSDGRQRYALPLSSVDEVVGPRELPVRTVDGAPVVIVRDGCVVPLNRLDALMGEAAPLAPPRDDEHIVLLQSGPGVTRALTVQDLLGRTEIVVKPMPRVFREIKGLGGAAVLGDGGMAFVLDPRTLFVGREEDPR